MLGVYVSTDKNDKDRETEVEKEEKRGVAKKPRNVLKFSQNYFLHIANFIAFRPTRTRVEPRLSELDGIRPSSDNENGQSWLSGYSYCMWGQCNGPK